jgi:hypothetical protein
MPSIIFEDDVSGAGAADLSANGVLYVAWDVTDVGGLGHLSGGADDEAVVGVGGFALGDRFDIVGGSAVDRWHAFVWFNTQYGLYVPSPAASSGVLFYDVATRIRWSLSLDATAHIRVFGDSI